MEIKWTRAAAEDLAYWQKHSLANVKRIKKLLTDIEQQPFAGLGKPEPLKHALQGLCSRRITQEHRLVYSYNNNTLIIYQCRFHYR